MQLFLGGVCLVILPAGKGEVCSYADPHLGLLHVDRILLTKHCSVPESKI